MSWRGMYLSGTYLLATVIVAHTDEVFEIVVDRLVDLQVEEGVPVYVLPLRPLERILPGSVSITRIARRVDEIDVLEKR